MQKNQTPFPAPNWREWKSLPSVQAWEACALSLSLDPYSVDASSRDDFGTLYERYRFPSQEVADEFDARLRWLLRKIAPWRALSLSEFAGFAVLADWPDLPPELVALAQTAAPASEAQPTETREAGGQEAQDGGAAAWQDKARMIADELHAKDKKGGAYSSDRDIADRVATEMRKQGINGPRGPLSGSTVLREAIQGGKWKRKA